MLEFLPYELEFFGGVNSNLSFDIDTIRHYNNPLIHRIMHYTTLSLPLMSKVLILEPNLLHIINILADCTQMQTQI